jgi:octaprenyl-diphosphate synthase
MQIQDVFRYFGNDLKRVEEHMEMYLRSEVRLIPEIIHHLIGSGGKRFRPSPAALTAAAAGGAPLPLSAVIRSSIATLFHDDVIDHAETRRGRFPQTGLGHAASVSSKFLCSKSFN